MPKFSLGNLAKLGVVKDVEAHSLAMGAWNDGRNVRFRNGRLEPFKGHTRIYGDLLHAPQGLLYTSDLVQSAWIYAGTTRVSAYVGGEHVEITPTGFSFSTASGQPWGMELFFNLPILNNGVDIPYIWPAVDSEQKLVALSNWPSTWRVRSLRAYKNYLIGLDLTEGSTRYPHLLIWSHPAAPGEVPISWDHTDPTLDAGRVDLGDGTGGILKTSLPLGNFLVVYKERSVWEVVTTGQANFPLANRQLFTGESGLGILNSRCAAVIKEETAHFVAGSESLYVHNGREVERVANSRVEDYLYQDIDPNAIDSSFVVANPTYKEAWFCYAEAGATHPTKALVWNWQEGQFTFRDLSPASAIASGVIFADGLDTVFWDAPDMEEDWVSWEGSWYGILHHPTERKLVQADEGNSKLYYLDEGNTFDGEPIEAWVERRYLPLTEEATGGQLRGTTKGDRLQMTEVWPQARDKVTIRLGSSQQIEGPISWTNPKTFNPKADRNLPFYVTGVELSLRVELDEPESRFSGLSVVVDRTGISR